MNTLKNKWWTLPLLMILAGILSRRLMFLFFQLFIIRTQDSDGVWSAVIPDWVDATLYVLNLLLLFAVILLVRHLCDRKTVIRSALILVAYEFVVLFLEQLSQTAFSGSGLFSLVYYLYIPGAVFTQLFSPVSSVIGLWPYAILVQFLPLLFIPFAKQSHSIEGCDTDES